MNETKLHIIEAASQLFAEKGFHAASMQDIANRVGIAKASLYFHFKSKDDLLLEICRYYFQLILEQSNELTSRADLTPREKLTQAITANYELLAKYGDFITMIMKEQTLQINAELKEFLFTMQAVALGMYKSRILEIYGEDAKPYALDAASLLKSMTDHYMLYILFHEKGFKPEKLAAFLMDRLDNIMHGMITAGQSPMLTEENMEDFMKVIKAEFNNS